MIENDAVVSYANFIHAVIQSRSSICF